MQNLSEESRDTSTQNLNQAPSSEIRHTVKNLGLLESIWSQVVLFWNIRDALKKQYEEHGSVVRKNFFGVKMFVLFGPEWNKVVYQNRGDLFSSYQGWEPILKRVFPGSIMAMDGADHLYQRRIMSQAFKKPMLVSYLEFMNGHISNGLSEWHKGDNFLVFPHVKNLTLDLATRVFMGEEPNEASNKMNKAFIDTVEASIAAIRLPIPPLKMWKGVKGREFLVSEFYRILPKKRAHNTPDFFSQFCHAESEDGEKFTDKEIVDHMIFLMMAAHDTTTSTLTTLFYTLAKKPEWQERLREKSLSLAKKHLDFEDLSALVEIEWAMKECLRMYPPLPTMPRRVNKNIEQYGVKFKRGDFVSISPVHTHYMDEYWEKPDEFDPGRWSPERAEYKKNSHQWIPFGGGAHMCIGQHFADLQVKAVMHQILLNFKWSVPEDYEVPYQLMPIAKPKDGLPINITRL